MMETKESKLPVEGETQLTAQAEDFAVENPTAAVRAPRMSGARSRARQQALLDAAAALAQQILLCPALAACICVRGRLTMSLEFIAAAVLAAAVDFFFGGFFSRRSRPVWIGGLRAALCCVLAFFQAGIASAGITLFLGALVYAALYAANARLALSTVRTSYRAFFAVRALTAAVLALALCGMGTLA